MKEITLKIDSLSYGPYGVGRQQGQAILVPLTVPGDEAEVRIVEEKSNYSVGELLRLTTPSPLRQTPSCPYAGQCGGCPWQHIQYEAQLAAKEKSVADALTRIGKLDGFDLLSILRSPKEYRYRRRIRLQADDRKRVGFHRASSHELVEIDFCLIAEPEVERRLNHAKEWLKELRTRVRHIEIVESGEDGTAVLAGKAEGDFAPQDDSSNSHFLEQSKEVRGLILFGRGWRRSWGRAVITMRPEEGLKMEVDGEVFSQVNREGNSHLVRELLQWGEFSNDDRALELYCGAGNFTLPIARRAREVLAIEGDSRSVENGRINSRLNGLKNIRWIRSHVPRAVRQLRDRGESFAKIVLNPPRSGAKGLEEGLTSLRAEKILYVSCNPPTLARDLAALSRRGYRLTRVRPVDLFPHTFHVETLAEMVRTEKAR
ncbi:MAG: 23S rRNA (uracil(1939)-C(5))-methyltransferase RlmD [Deltaproteobacteria bacterium]|nr:23S rRNA (uracil(1939)-C(5))-methyltransferase RlmD [Deltaproteobacteria bacterium]